MKMSLFLALFTFSVFNISFAFGGNDMEFNSESLESGVPVGVRASNGIKVAADAVKNLSQGFSRNTLSEPPVLMDKSFEMNRYSRELGVGGF